MVYCGCYSEEFDCGDNRYNQIKENLSISYLSAISSYLGAELKKTDRLMDNAGYDATVTLPPDREERYCPWRIDAQLKCTSSPKYSADGDLLFDIGVEVYKSMMCPNTVPFILFVLVIPTDVNEWVTCNTDELIMRNTMFWIDPKDYPKEICAGQKTVQLKIPKNNVVSKDSLYDLLCRGNGE